MIPPLRERVEDIPLLAEALSRKLSESMGMKPPRLTTDAAEALQRYAFAGNVRELENTLERALTLCNGTEITTQDLQLQVAADESEAETVMGGKESLDDYLERIERATIEKALAQTQQNKTAAAKLLGISFRALRYKLEKLGIE
jgi:two-component system response regulator PilR (NtrC family)